MKSNSSLQCIYYPSSIIKTSLGLASFCLYYDDVFLLVPQWESLSTGLFLENHQKYIASDEYIASYVSSKDKRARRNIINSMLEMDTAFFLGDNHLLVQENVIQIIHPDIRAKDWNFPSAASEFMKDTADQIHVAEDLIKQYKELSKSYDDYFFRWIFHALLLAIDLELIPVADCRLPISLKTAEQPSSENISAILAEECLRLALPRCTGAKPEDILDVRHKLADELYAFRMAMKKLCFILRTELVSPKTSSREIRREAKFLAETVVEPELFELRRKIELEKGKLWRRVFGRALGWIPLIGQALTCPSISLIADGFKKASKDIEDLTLSATDLSSARRTTVAFLLDVEESFASDV